MVELQFPANGMTVDTYTNIQKTFMEKIRTQGTTSALDWLMEEKKGQERSHPLPICFQWEQDGSVDYTKKREKEKAANSNWTSAGDHSPHSYVCFLPSEHKKQTANFADGFNSYNKCFLFAAGW